MKNKYINSVWDEILSEAFNQEKEPFNAMYDITCIWRGVDSTCKSENDFKKMLVDTDVPMKIITESFPDPIFKDCLKKSGVSGMSKIPLISFLSIYGDMYLPCWIIGGTEEELKPSEEAWAWENSLAKSPKTDLITNIKSFHPATDFNLKKNLQKKTENIYCYKWHTKNPKNVFSINKVMVPKSRGKEQDSLFHKMINQRIAELCKHSYSSPKVPKSTFELEQSINEQEFISKLNIPEFQIEILSSDKPGTMGKFQGLNPYLSIPNKAYWWEEAPKKK